MLFVCYDGCSTCRRARQWLDARGADYTVRPIKTENPTAAELLAWREKAGVPMRKLFNTSGQLYRRMGLKDRLDGMSEEEMAALLATDGMLVRRPLLIGEDFALVGFREKEWEAVVV
jgi:arsenate reductase